MRAPGRLLAAAVAALALAGAGCLGPDESETLQAEVVALTQEVGSLQAALDDVQARHDRTVAATERLQSILADPSSFGTEDEVAAQLAQMATEDALMVSDVFGSSHVRSAWQSTLFGWGPTAALEARLETVEQWVSDDGSMSGSLWVWHGDNAAGNPFELAGVQVSTHDGTGRATEIRILFPYSAARVLEATDGAGTPTGTLRCR